MKKKALISSILTIALCLSLIAGSTFALFTSESTVNVAVTSGKVDVVATIEEGSIWTKELYDENYTNDLESMFNATVEFDDGLKISKMVPGDAIKFNVTITNNSNVGIKYRTVLKADGDVKLLKALKVTVGTDIAEYDGKTIKSDWTDWTGAETTKTVEVVIEFPDADDNNDYQDLNCTLYYTVEAVQGNAEMPDEWDGVTTEEIKKDENDGRYHITTAEQFYYFVSGDFSIPAGNTVVLDNDIDLAGATVKGYANSVFDSNFDGQGHTVSNFTVKTTYFEEYYCGLFPYICTGCYVKDLTVKDAAAIAPNGTGMAGMIAGAAYDAVVENCHAVNCVIFGEKKVGSIVGYTAGTVTNCSATDCEVYCHVGAGVASAGIAPQAGEVVGFNDNGTVTDISSENVTVTFEASYVADGVILHNGAYEISNEKGLKWFCDQVNEHDNKFDGMTVKLVADIDLNNEAWTPIGCSNGNNSKTFNGTFDGNGYTISNLKVTGTAEGVKGAGLFGYVYCGAVKNVTVKNANVTGYSHVAALIGSAMCTTIDNCHVENAVVTANTWLNGSGYDDGDKVGAIVGYFSCEPTGSMTNCTVENCAITGYRHLGGMIGYFNAYNDDQVVINGNSVDGATVTSDKTHDYKSNEYSAPNAYGVGELTGYVAKTFNGTNTVTNVTVTND